MGGSFLPALDRSGRRRALLNSCLALVAVGVADVALSGDARRAGVWGGWIALYLLAARLIGPGPPWVTYAVSFVTSTAAVVSLFLLAALGDGSRSVLFLVATMLPVLSVLFSPDDVLGAAYQGVLVLAVGILLQTGEGADAATLALFGVVVAVVTAAAIHASLGHRRRVERLLEEQGRAAHHEVEAERERQRADRWASMGKLAEGVAHDVNSPLGSLRSNLAFVREEIAAGRARDREVDEAIEDSLQALERIRETVASLRAISVPQVPPGDAPPGAKDGEAA